MLGLFLRDEARSDISDAHRWYEERRQGLGGEFLEAVRLALIEIEAYPERYPIALDDIRKTQLRRFPYALNITSPAALRACHPVAWTRFMRQR